MDDRLHSERQGRGRTLSLDGFISLLWKRIVQARRAGLLDQSLRGHLDTRWGIRQAPEIRDAEEYLLVALQTDHARGLAHSLVEDASALPSGLEWNPLETSAHQRERLDLALDLVELLHKELVALPVRDGEPGPPSGADKEAGQAEFRDLVNPALAMHEPPLELLPIGRIVEQDPERRELYLQALPPDSDRQLADPVAAAKNLFLKRGATVGDKKAAVQALAAALEHLRAEAKTVLLRKDEAALFELANGFAIRHNNRRQKVDYDSDLWLDWMFHVYLATVYMIVGIKERSR